MANTFQILQIWDKGQAFSERMAAKILAVEDFEEIDPQSPMGGPDGTKDILCSKNGKDYVVGCYFASGQNSFVNIKEKFEGDLKGVKKHNADGFIFVTNQKITPSERTKLSKQKHEVIIYHAERVCGILDSPKGYGIRLEYLEIELTKAEQLSFLNAQVNLKEEFRDMRKTLDKLLKVTTKMAGEVYEKDKYQYDALTSVPISGLQYSSRLSFEDLLSIHKIIIESSDFKEANKFLGFRKLDVWIGNPGEAKNKADFIAPPPAEIPILLYDLLEWWRKEYMKVKYAEDDQKITAIAKFHERFLSIHPFLDGNGRVARAIASLQFKDLLDKEVQFERLNRKEYYDALQNARNGSDIEINNIFLSLIKK